MKLHEVLDHLLEHLSINIYPPFNIYEYQIVMGSIYFEMLSGELKWCSKKDGVLYYYVGIPIKIDETNRTVISLEKRG